MNYFNELFYFAVSSGILLSNILKSSRILSSRVSIILGISFALFHRFVNFVRSTIISRGGIIVLLSSVIMAVKVAGATL